MIEVQGRVIARTEAFLEIEVIRDFSCSGCAARISCGQGLNQQLGLAARSTVVKVPCDTTTVQVNDLVLLGIQEQQLVHSAVQVYLLPLMALLVVAALVDRLTVHEPLVILSALAGASVVFFWLRQRAAHQCQVDLQLLQPAVLQVVEASSRRR